MSELLTDEHPVTGELLAFVEIPKGSRNKYEYDEGIGQVVLDRFLSSSMVYPTDYGFLIGHRGRDGDPLDVMVCVSEPTFPGCVIPVKPIALFVMQDEKGEDDKIVCVPTHDPGWNTPRRSSDIPEAAPARDHPLLLGLQAARGQGGRGRRLALARGGARGDRRRPPAADGARRAAAAADACHAARDCRLYTAARTRPRRIFPVQDRGLAAYIAELIGTLFLVFVVGIVVTLFVADQPTGVADGLGLRRRRPRARLRPLHADHRPSAQVSGGHFNPAVTVAAAALRRIDPVDAVVYILAQLSGGVLGALLVKGLLLDEGRATGYGNAEVSPLLGGNFGGAVVEALGTFLLVLAVCAVALNPRARQEWAPLAIGTTLGFVVMIFGPLTGASFNPARWFGPALIGDEFGGSDLARLHPRAARRRGRRRRRLPLRDRGPAVRRGRRAADLRRTRRRPGGQGCRGRGPATARTTPSPSAAHSVAARAARHLLAQLHALALADLPLLLQVLRLRDASGRTCTRPTRSSSSSSRRCGATPRSCWCSPARRPR